ncbi:hippurate hydrolase [Promicromonospora iranensis]|uniref:Hippurate hydrolase n=2 Tax=Promicromonospora iranensis TaxID=1105144 RepID=A0ABU2CWK3_9MICO|nr:hippurate hydrolase [Promicromonospora iranensis]
MMVPAAPGIDVDAVLAPLGSMRQRLRETYVDLHAHPELSFEEHRTAALAVERLAALGFVVHAGVGGTGVAGVLVNGDGPCVLLRADMDALPVTEDTGLPYASTVRTTTTADGVESGVMHACGHDVHVTALLGAADLLSRSRPAWSGTLVVVLQPAEELGQGARAMVDDGLYDLVPRPDIVLGQHVAPVAAGLLGVHGGPAFAGTDSVDIRLVGRGGHGSRPEATVDPVVLAASTVLRLQTIVSREVAAGDAAVVTVGTLHAGTKENIIPDEARLGVNVRSFDETVRNRVLAAIERIARGEAATAGAPQPPEITIRDAFPPVINDPTETERTRGVLAARFGAERVIDPGPVSGSEDVGVLATAAGVPIVYWLLGGWDPAAFQAAVEAGTVDQDIPSNHSPRFAPVPHPTLETGVEALVVAALDRLAPPAPA